MGEWQSNYMTAGADMKAEVPDDLPEAAWHEVRRALRQSMGARSFDHWLKPVQLASFSSATGTVRLSVASSFMAGWSQLRSCRRFPKC